MIKGRLAGAPRVAVARRREGTTPRSNRSSAGAGQSAVVAGVRGSAARRSCWASGAHASRCGQIARGFWSRPSAALTDARLPASSDSGGEVAASWTPGAGLRSSVAHECCDGRGAGSLLWSIWRRQQPQAQVGFGARVGGRTGARLAGGSSFAPGCAKPWTAEQLSRLLLALVPNSFVTRVARLPYCASCANAHNSAAKGQGLVRHGARAAQRRCLLMLAAACSCSPSPAAPPAQPVAQ